VADPSMYRALPAGLAGFGGHARCAGNTALTAANLAGGALPAEAAWSAGVLG
jgi:hypothetical protein